MNLPSLPRILLFCAFAFLPKMGAASDAVADFEARVMAVKEVYFYEPQFYLDGGSVGVQLYDPQGFSFELFIQRHGFPHPPHHSTYSLEAPQVFEIFESLAAKNKGKAVTVSAKSPLEAKLLALFEALLAKKEVVFKERVLEKEEPLFPNRPDSPALKELRKKLNQPPTESAARGLMEKVVASMKDRSLHVLEPGKNSPHQKAVEHEITK